MLGRYECPRSNHLWLDAAVHSVRLDPLVPFKMPRFLAYRCSPTAAPMQASHLTATMNPQVLITWCTYQVRVRGPHTTIAITVEVFQLSGACWQTRHVFLASWLLPTSDIEGGIETGPRLLTRSSSVAMHAKWPQSKHAADASKSQQVRGTQVCQN